jgi:YHS domain-containing protein
MMRQTGKQILTIALWLLLAVMARADGLVTAIVADPLTGTAIDGYDPVTYFTDPEPRQGSPDFEYEWGGVPWYFVSAANRDVFIRSPTTYAPQYGGHCLTSLARGYLSDGKPRLYVIEAMKLYFFYSTANRDAFALSKSDTLKTAAAKWPELSRELTGLTSEPALVDSPAEPTSSETPAPGVSEPAAEAPPAAH